MKGWKRVVPASISGIFLSVRLAVVLLLLMALTMCLAYWWVAGRDTIFEPMNQVGLWSWMQTYGAAHLRYTAWFFLFLFLAALLAVNTLCCTASRLIRLKETLAQARRQRILFTLLIHMMHAGMVLILAGYLASYTLGQTESGIVLVPGTTSAVANGALRLELVSMKLPVYEGKRLEGFSGSVINPRIKIRAEASSGKRTLDIGFNSPGLFRGYALFLQKIAPIRQGTMNSRKYVVIDIRKDPGMVIYIAGIMVFVSGLTGYLYLHPRLRAERRHTC